MSEETHTKDLAITWDQAREQLRIAKDQIHKAETRLLNATNALGKRIDPGDQEVDEVFSLWVRFGPDDKRVLSSIKDETNSYRVVRGTHRKTLKPLLLARPTTFAE